MSASSSAEAAPAVPAIPASHSALRAPAAFAPWLWAAPDATSRNYAWFGEQREAGAPITYVVSLVTRPGHSRSPVLDANEFYIGGNAVGFNCNWRSGGDVSAFFSKFAWSQLTQLAARVRAQPGQVMLVHCPSGRFAAAVCAQLTK